jgi:hypothetical protein
MRPISLLFAGFYRTSQTAQNDVLDLFRRRCKCHSCIQVNLSSKRANWRNGRGGGIEPPTLWSQRIDSSLVSHWTPFVLQAAIHRSCVPEVLWILPCQRRLHPSGSAPRSICSCLAQSVNDLSDHLRRHLKPFNGSPKRSARSLPGNAGGRGFILPV